MNVIMRNIPTEGQFNVLTESVDDVGVFILDVEDLATRTCVPDADLRHLHVRAFHQVLVDRPRARSVSEEEENRSESEKEEGEKVEAAQLHLDHDCRRFLAWNESNTVVMSRYRLFQTRAVLYSHISDMISLPAHDDMYVNIDGPILAQVTRAGLHDVNMTKPSGYICTVPVE